MDSSHSSPFVEHPRRSFIDDSDILNEGSDTNYRQIISNLKFQLESVKIEKKLLEQDKASVEKASVDLITKKSEEYNKLKKDFDYLYEEKKSANSKFDNQAQIYSTKIKELNDVIQTLKQDKSSISNEYRDVEGKFNRNLRRFEQVRSDLNYQLQANDELTSRMKGMQNTIDKLQNSNDDLVNNMNLISAKSEEESSRDNHLENLQTRNSNLMKTNSQLQLKIDKLLQNKTSVELLRQKNISLMKKIEYLESVEEKCCKLEIENLELNTRFEDYFKVIDEMISNDETNDPRLKINKFLTKFKELQYQTVVLKGENEEIKAELDNVAQVIDSLKVEIEEKAATTTQLMTSLSKKEEQLSKLEKQKFLNSKEIEYLRESLAQLDKEFKDKNDNKATEQYLQNLEKLVDGYKNEINSLQKQLDDSVRAELEPPKKIPRTQSARSSLKLNDEILNENRQLKVTIKEYEVKTNTLNQKISSLHKLTSKREQLQILQLKSNLLAKDQIVKQETLNALRKENDAIIAKYVRKDLPEHELIPKAIFERQENDYQLLEQKLEQITKRSQRLSAAHSQKSKDILNTISKYFGYSLEFIPSSVNPTDVSSRIKLTSKFTKKERVKGSSYVIIDIDAKSMKAYGNSEFITLYSELSKSYDKNQIPCFLSALNLRLSEIYGSKGEAI